MKIFVDSRLTKGMQRDLAEVPANPFLKGFTLEAYNGLHFRFKQTCAVCPLQYEVYNSVHQLCGYVHFRSQCFTVTALDPEGTKTILQIADESLESWPDEAFARLAAEVLAEWKALE